MEKAERFMLFSIISIIFFITLAIASSFQGYSILIYCSMVPALFSFLFFSISVHAMGQRDLFDIFGSLIHQARKKVRRTRKSLKPSEKVMGHVQKPKLDQKIVSDLSPSQARISPQPPPPPPPPPPTELNSSDVIFSQEREEIIKCPRCGQKLHEKAAFCGKCGLKVRERGVAQT